ncbi:hypothetical protein RhiirB3_455485 [Rhizophagus irregularis]|nr:hypothetical protein RhiirB3_455485 [Rhizophagus irregularis]
MDKFQIPFDLGQIPGKIHCREGFSNFTADQWRIFFTIYATVSLWSHLLVHDRKILHHFVRVCIAFVSQILELNAVRESHERLIEIVKLIKEHYGRDKITPNLHLSLHLSESEADEFSADEMERFWLNSRNIQQSIVTGSESFPGEMLGPASENVVMSNSMLDLLVEYYLATYETLEF